MGSDDRVHPNAPTGGGGPGNFTSASPLGLNPAMDGWHAPGPLCASKPPPVVKLNIPGVVIAGGPLTPATIIAVNVAAKSARPEFRRYVAYADIVKVGGSLAWRANNPGNLRGASTKIGTVGGAVGNFAVFASLEAGRAAQKSLYLTKYGDMKVKDAIDKLTPPSENDTTKYLAQLKAAGVDLDKDMKSQIDKVMPAVEANEGLIPGIDVARVP